jgi:ubiquinone/menaquinone biosynthesis C-methylase UbiE
MPANTSGTDSSRVAARQQAYYAATAHEYDAIHGNEEQHKTALHLMAAFVKKLQVASLLDVGCGTGRALSYFRMHFPHLMLRGVDTSPEMLRIAAQHNRIPPEWLQVTGDRLPFADATFDVAIAMAVLHHVPEPSVVISEMLRVTRTAVFISDGNKYGNAPLGLALVKVAAQSLGILRHLEWIRHGGRRWTTSAGDGLSYPFSVYDHISHIRNQCTKVFVIPTSGRPKLMSHPLLHASHALVCALKLL